MTIDFDGTSYPITDPFNSSIGCLQILLQHIDVKSTVAPGGVFFVPTSIKEGGYFNLSAGAGINFIWDEASQSAKVVSNGVGKYVNDSFFGIAFNAEGKPVENAQGRYVYPISLRQITSLTRVTP